MRRLVASLIVLVSAMPGVPAPADPLLSPRKDSIESNVLHQRREIEAHLPEESKQDPLRATKLLPPRQRRRRVVEARGVATFG
jgi:hypothetical protein